MSAQGVLQIDAMKKFLFPEHLFGQTKISPCHVHTISLSLGIRKLPRVCYRNNLVGGIYYRLDV
jgi:hypothetical protein